MKNFITCLLCTLLCLMNKARAQNMAVNTDGSIPDASAMVDISSTTKGLLVPRMTTAQQNSISLPATGLLVFNTTDNVFKVNTGTAASPIWTTLSYSGASIVSLNGLTNTSQTFTTGIAGTDFGINSSGSLHTFNIPTSSATNRGALAAADWTTFNAKQGALSVTTTGSSGAASLTGTTLNIPNHTLAGLGGISLSNLSATAPLIYNNTTGVFSINQATTSASGYLSNTDWNTFNGKQTALSGTANRITIASNIIDISPAYTGQNSITTLGTIATGIWNGTAVGATYGGTGQTSVTTGDLLYGSAANTWSKLTAGTNGQVLTLAGGIPSWAANPGATAWSLTGNSVTAGSHFLGSTNNVSLRMRTNDIERMVIDSNGRVGIGTNTLTEALNVNGNIALSTATAKVIGNAGNLTFEQNGDAYGTTRLSIQNRNGVNGAMFEQAGSVDLVDFIFKGLTNQRNIRFENRSAFSYLGYPLPEFQIGIGSDPTLVISDNSSAFRKGNVGIGLTNPAAVLHLGAGTATAGKAPLKFTAGTNLTTPETGAVEFNGTHFYGTVGATRYQLDQQSTIFSGSFSGDVTGTQNATLVGKINGVSLAGLGTGILKNTTGTGLPSIAVAADFPVLNQNTTGTAVNVTGTVGVTNGGTGLTSATTGDLLYGSAVNTYSKLPAGTNGQVLTLTGGIPSWSANPGTTAWSLTGNSVTAGSHFLGSTNNVSLRMRTNNIERMLVDSTGKVGIGLSDPAALLDVKDQINIRNTGTVSQMIFTNTAGSGDFRIAGDGGDIFWQGGGGRSLQMGSYWGTVLGGDRQTAVLPSFIAGIANTGVLVQGQRDASVPLAIQANSATQSANLTEWRNASGSILNTIDKTGRVAIGAAAFNGTNPEKLLVDAGTTTSVNAIVGKGSIDNYLQLNIQNNSSGTSASSDVVATANNGNETTNYVDMGINGGSNTNNIMGGANDGYLYTMGNNFLLGTGNAAKSLIFMTGGTSQAANERMRIDGSGNIGIGTTAPTQKLDITGNLKVSGAFMPNNNAGNLGYFLQSNGTGTAPAWVDATPYLTSLAWMQNGNSVSAVKSFGTTSNYDLPFITNNTERMRLSATGDVGIGTSTFNATNPEQLLVDAGTTTSVNAIVGKGSIDSYLQLNIQNNSAGASASSDVVATANNGNETTNYVDMGINGGGNTNNIMGGANDGYLYTMGNNFLLGTGNAAKSLVFMTGGTSQAANERMRIDGSGNVGIGTTAPTSTLSVMGSQSISYRSVTGNYTVLNTDYVIISTGGATPTWTLPAASSYAGRVYRLINHGTTNLTLSQAITTGNGVTSTSLLYISGSNTYEIISDGTVWRKMN